MGMPDHYLTLTGRLNPRKAIALDLPICKGNQEWFFADYSPRHYNIGTIFDFDNFLCTLAHSWMTGHLLPYIGDGHWALCQLTFEAGFIPRVFLDLPITERFIYNPDSITIWRKL
jgi:hypothetical protein